MKVPPSLEPVRQLVLGSLNASCGKTAAAEQAYTAAIASLAKPGNSGSGGGGGSGGCEERHAAAFASYELGLLLCRRSEVGIPDQYIKFKFSKKQALFFSYLKKKTSKIYL